MVVVVQAAPVAAAPVVAVRHKEQFKQDMNDGYNRRESFKS